MIADQSPFRPGWPFLELPGIRECDRRTYCHFPYGSLPSLAGASLSGDLGWLKPVPQWLSVESFGNMAADDRSQANRHYPAIAAEAERLSLVLPRCFHLLMCSPDLQARIPSATACYFDLPDRIAPSPFGDTGYLLRFICDQQWALLWYLYLTTRGEHCVVASEYLLGENDPDAEQVPPEQMLEGTFFCAPDLETFLYRFWLENRLWFSLRFGRSLTEPMEEYAAAYARR